MGHDSSTTERKERVGTADCDAMPRSTLPGRLTGGAGELWRRVPSRRRATAERR